jgi:hypothetical protein
MRGDSWRPRATIHGSGFGDNPEVNAGWWAMVSVQWANGVEIHGTVSVDPNAPDTMETVTVTSRGWGGQGFMPAPGANPTANATVQIRGAGAPRCGVPVNFRQFGIAQCYQVSDPRGRLRLYFTWDSSTGDRQHLQGCYIREAVRYPGGPTPPSPPFPNYTFQYPPATGVSATNELMSDDHDPPSGEFVRPYSESTFSARQDYEYRCQCQGTEEWTVFDGFRNLLIERKVTSDNGTSPWRYEVRTQGEVCSFPLPGQ